MGDKDPKSTAKAKKQQAAQKGHAKAAHDKKQTAVAPSPGKDR